MKTFLPVIAAACVALTPAAHGDDIATSVIRSEFLAAYNSLNNSEEELNKAATINSALRLQHILLHETTNDELRVCYALRVIEDQIRAVRKAASLSESERTHERLSKLLKQQTDLARQFRAIQDKKTVKADLKPIPFSENLLDAIRLSADEQDELAKELLQQLTRSLVPTEKDARRLALGAFVNQPGVDAREVCSVTGLYRLGRDVPGLGITGNLVWEFRFHRLGAGVTGIVWVSTATQKTKVLLPADL